MPSSNDTPCPDRKTILVVDDHPMIRDALHELLKTLDPRFTTEHALDMKQMQTMLRNPGSYSHAVIDLTLPDAAGLDAIVAARKAAPELPVIVFSGRTEQDLVLRALRLGVMGYIPKTLYNDLVVNAFRTVFAGQIYIPRQAVGETRQLPYGSTAAARLTTSDPRDLGLTDRQIDVLNLILKGLPNKLICRQLELAEGTVKVHVSAVLRALGVRNRTQAVIAATSMGLRANEKHVA